MKTPAASRRTLVLVAGLVWSAVGLVLIAVAIGWAARADGPSFIYPLAGVIAGWVVYRFGFSKLAKKNRRRIFEQAPGKEKVCVFAFQNIRSYFIIVIMMAMGYTLRHLPIEKIYLSPIYMAIGVGLFLSSLGYYQEFSLRR